MLVTKLPCSRFPQQTCLCVVVVTRGNTEKQNLRRPRHIVITPRIGTPRHVRDDGPDVALGPERPPQRDVGASGCLGVQGGGRGPGLAALGVPAALEVGERDVLDGAVALDGPRDALRRGRDVGVLVGLVEGVDFVGDGGVVDVAVGGDEGGYAEGWEDELHGCFCFFVFCCVFRREARRRCVWKNMVERRGWDVIYRRRGESTGSGCEKLEKSKPSFRLSAHGGCCGYGENAMWVEYRKSCDTQCGVDRETRCVD